MNRGLACWCLLGLLLIDCSGDQAAELYKAAEAEEQKNNQTGAQAIYERIIREFPESGAAQEARKRLTPA